MATDPETISMLIGGAIAFYEILDYIGARAINKLTDTVCRDVNFLRALNEVYNKVHDKEYVARSELQTVPGPFTYLAKKELERTIMSYK